MSGQQVGTAVGFVAGFFLPGGPQVWAAIGGMVGGYIDPTKVQGPRLSDGMEVTAKDGIPNPWGFGTFAIGANVIWTAGLEEHSHTDDGKGSGMEQETFTYTRSYALGICRAKRNADGTYSDIAGVLRAKHNGKVVYNVQPDATPEQLANNAKFLENHKFYLGGDGQLPDPTVESYLGVGNAPAWPGQVTMVATDEDQTQSQGSIGTWEFVVAMDGESSSIDYGYFPGRLSEFTNASWPLVDPETDYVLTGYMDGVSDSFTASTVSEIVAHFTQAGRSPSHYLGYANAAIDAPTPGIGIDLGTVGVSNYVDQGDIIDNSEIFLVYNDFDPSTYVDQAVLGDGGAACLHAVSGEYLQSRRGEVSTLFASDPGAPWQLDQACGDGTQVYGLFPLCIRATRKRVAPNIGEPIPDAPGWRLLPDGTVSPLGEFEEVAGTFQVLAQAESPSDNHYEYYETGPVLESTDPNYNNQAFWEDAYAESVGLPDDWVYGVDYPLPLATAFRPTADVSTLSVEGVALGQIVAECCRRCGLESDDIDVSALTETVDGFKVAVETTGEAVIASLMDFGHFDMAEWDDKLRGVLRGGDAVFALGPDDLAARDGAIIEETEIQEVELLRLMRVKAMDPDAGYVETTQIAERRSSTVAADGEQTLHLPVVASKDKQARVADIGIKKAWSENRKLAWSLPYTRAELTPTDVGTITDREGRVTRVQLREMTEDSGLVEIREAMLSRQSVYTSNVEGVTHAPPTDNTPGLIGPTFGWVGNLPSLRTQDNVPGVYVAACGLLPGWRAAAVLLSVDGGASFSQVMTITQPSRMGVLHEGVGAAEEPIQVFMRSGELHSITDAQLAARGNAFAITSDVGTAGAASEIGQFRDEAQDVDLVYSLTETVRGGLGTTAAAHDAGDPFVMLSSVYFLPLDISLAGQTLIFKFVSYGTSADDADEYPFVFNPLFTSVTVSPITVSGENITVGGQPIYVVTQNA
jgi:hypothetical protein